MSQELKGLEVQGLAKRIGDFTLEADFSLGAGERMAIQAPSGAGKTSLLRVLAGLEAADRGRIRLDGRDLTHVSPPARDIGVVFQDGALFDSLSVLENAAFGLRMRGVSRSQRRSEALQWLERVGLADRADSGVTRLSGGERQRVAFVRALIWRPRLLLLDEPFSALNPELRHSLRALLLQLLRDTPTPMILVTHDREDADQLATTRWGIETVSPGLRRLTRQP